MVRITLKVTSLKGRVFNNVTIEDSSTILQLKTQVGSMAGIRANETNLIYRVKPLSQDSATLRSYGINRDCQLHLVSRLSGGAGRMGCQEVAQQMRIVKRAKLFGMATIEPGEDDMTWAVIIHGPRKTPYEGRLLCLSIAFPDNYPYSAPRVRFNHDMFHPNVWPTGELCWHDDDESGSKYFADVLLGCVMTLLEKPNPDSPANPEAATLYRNNPVEWAHRVRQVVDMVM